MFNEKQIDEAIKNGRADVAAEMSEQSAKLADAESKQDEFYANADEKTLYDLTVNGDDEACAYYIRMRIMNDALIRSDVKYLEAAIKNRNFSAALIGSYLFGVKNGRYENIEKELFCHAVLEQYGNKPSHKRLVKAYKKNKPTIDRIDDTVLNLCLDHWAAATFHGDKYYSFTINVDPCDKASGFPNYRSARIMQASLTHENGRETDAVALYTAYTRGKDDKERVARLNDALVDELGAIAQKTNLKAGDIYIDGRRSFHYGAATAAKSDKPADAVEILSNAELNISVADGGRLKSNVCTYCGGALDLGGVCTSCGKAAQANDGDIVIHKGKDVEALMCTQCGAPVTLDAGGKTAYCSACGTTFAVNGSSLTGSVFGLNYENIRADMPEGAELPKVEFVRASIAGGAVTAVMPRNFIVMSDEMRRIKYPANAPKYIYTTPDSTVNLNMNFLQDLKEADVFAFGGQMLSALKSAYPTAKFGAAKKLVKPRNIFFVDFITQAIDQTVYNAMFFFSYQGKQGIGSWNCLGKDRWFWSPVFEHAVETIEFKE